VPRCTRTIHPDWRPLAKKPNYDFERRKKEQDRKNKKEAKREERLQRKRDGDTSGSSEDGENVATPSDDLMGPDAQADGQ
jgi:hypothetical protein